MGKVLAPNYFSFCLQNNYSEIPLNVREQFFSGTASSLNALMAAYWRVKEWRVDYSAFDTAGSPITATGVYGFDVTSEEQLVCPNDFIEKSFSFSGTTFFAEHSFSIFRYFSNLYYGANISNGFAYQMLYYGADDGTAGASVYSGTYDVCSGAGIGGTVSVNVADAGQLNFPYKICEDREGQFGTISISAQSYWSYGGTYNTSTGQPL
jgi:hypothetical protein